MTGKRKTKSKTLRALGAVIRVTRSEQGYTQERFAAHAGIDRSYLGAIERGEFNLTIQTLLRIGAGLHVSPADLLANTLNGEPSPVVGRVAGEVSEAPAGVASLTRTPIPAAVAVLLREALYAQLQRACEAAPGGMPEAHTPAAWTGALAQLDGARAALDAIGWETPARQQDIEVELDRAMIGALEADIDSWAWLSEQVNETRASRLQAAAKAETIERFLASVKPPDAEAKGGDT